MKESRNKLFAECGKRERVQSSFLNGWTLWFPPSLAGVVVYLLFLHHLGGGNIYVADIVEWGCCICWKRPYPRSHEASALLLTRARTLRRITASAKFVERENLALVRRTSLADTAARAADQDVRKRVENPPQHHPTVALPAGANRTGIICASTFGMISRRAATGTSRKHRLEEELEAQEGKQRIR